MSKILRLLRYDWPAHFFLSLTNWLPDNTVFLRLRGFLVGPFLGSCGKDLRLGRNITFYNPEHIHIGDHVYIALGCWFMAGSPINLGDEVQVGPYCVFASSNHTRHHGSFRYGKQEMAPIVVEFGTWISAHTTVTAGSRIGSGTVVGAGSVVTGNLDSDVLAAGQPAKVIKRFANDS